MRYPTLPALMVCCGIWLIPKIPISSAKYSLPVLTNLIRSPFLSVPLKIRKITSTPRKELNWESKIIACSGASGSPLGGGIFSITLAKISSIPIPSLPEANTMSSRLQPNRSITSSATTSGSAPGKSILFKTGMISRSCPSAKYKLEMVCASTPWEASTISNAPSHAAMERDTSYEKST